MHNLNAKHPTRRDSNPCSTSEFRATSGQNEPSGPANWEKDQEGPVISCGRYQFSLLSIIHYEIWACMQQIIVMKTIIGSTSYFAQAVGGQRVITF